MMRSELLEQKEQTIARFLGGLNQEIAHMAELQPYCSFEDVCKLSIKVEKQRKVLKTTASRTFNRENSFYKGGTSFNKTEAPTKDKGKERVLDAANAKPNCVDKKCFKCHGYGHFQAYCPNQRVMTIREIEEIEEALQEEDGGDDAAESEDEIVEEADNGNMLVLKRVLHSEIGPNEEQRENLFQTRCTIKGRVCSIIINSGSCTNVASSTLVDKLSRLLLIMPNHTSSNG